MKDDMRFNINSGSGIYEVSSALTVGGRRQPRLSDGIKHPCLCTRADGSQYVIVSKPNRTTNRKPRNVTTNVTRKMAYDIIIDHDFTA